MEQNIFPNTRARSIATFALPFIVVSSYIFLAFQPDLRQDIPALAGVSALIMAAISVALYLGEKGGPIWPSGVVVSIAVFIRLLFLFRPPELSDDLYRYLWDGTALLSGHNPYSLSPSSANYSGDEAQKLLGLVNHPHLITIYPPTAQISFAVGTFLGGLLGIKSLLVAMDIAVCILVVKILSLQKLPPTRAAIYAWHPLPVLEIASSGHIDGAAIFFMALALLLLVGQPADKNFNFMKNRIRAPLAGFLFSLAVMSKLFPLVFFPAFLRIANGRIKAFSLAAVAGVAMLSIPFLPDLSNMFSTLNAYAQNWEFAGFLFKAIRGLTSSGFAARLTLAVVFFAILAISSRKPFLAKAEPVVDRPPSPFFLPSIKAMHAIALAYLLLTPTLHPWYALYLAFLLPFYPTIPGLTLSWAVLLFYRTLIPYSILGKWDDDGEIPALVWGATVLAMAVAWILNRRGSSTQDFRG